jgi:3',5'-cyclic AMP phosphodiesterase CpdA
MPSFELKPAESYRVAVIGDSQKGLANLRNLVRRVQQEDLRAIFHTGDLVAHNDEGHYRLTALYLSRAGLELPFIAVPGNHDVKGGTARFERAYGPLEKTVDLGKAAFVGLDNSLSGPPDLGRLERRISALGPREAVVLLMHIPPLDVRGETVPGYGPFLGWLEKEPRVKYVLAGHIHTYLRKTVGSAVVIANGVGGDYESWQLGQKVFATILEVNGARISDRTVDLPPEHGVIENLEHFAIGHLAEAYRSRPALCWGGTALLAGIVLWAWRTVLFRRPAAGA